MGKFNQVEQDAEAVAARVKAAVDAWYDKHFHRHSVAGTQPISAQEKDDLHKAVASAVQPQESEPAKTSAQERD